MNDYDIFSSDFQNLYSRNEKSVYHDKEFSKKSRRDCPVKKINKTPMKIDIKKINANTHKRKQNLNTGFKVKKTCLMDPKKMDGEEKNFFDNKLSRLSNVLLSGSNEESNENKNYSLFSTNSVNVEDYLKGLDELDKKKSPSYVKEAFENLPNSVTQNYCAFLREKNLDSDTIPLSGSFHDVFKGNKDIVYRFVQPGLDKKNKSCVIAGPSGTERRVPYTVYVLYNGYMSYKKMENVVKDVKGVRVAELYNNPVKDGYWEMEFVGNAVNIFDNKRHLQTVGKCLQKMVKENTILFPDFRPSNVKVDDKGDIVIIDFCEDKTIDHYRNIPVKQLVREYIVEWANGDNKTEAYLKEFVGV